MQIKGKKRNTFKSGVQSRKVKASKRRQVGATVFEGWGQHWLLR